MRKLLHILTILVLTTLGLPSWAVPLAPPSAEDLSETIDVQITPSIKSLAESLENNPVKIYNWVYHNIQFVPSYGSLQGSQQTLESKRGNAFDTASLLIALLRSANISARYTYGTVEIPSSRVMNWLGGVKSPAVAMQLLSQGRIPNKAVIEKGKISKIQIEHVWVNAWVDFIPSGGAIHQTGDSWIPLDASFKQHLFTEGVDWETVPFDGAALAAQLDTENSENWVTGIDKPLLQNTLESYKNALSKWLSENGISTLAEALGHREIIEDPRPELAASLPYQVIAKTENFADLPDKFRHQYRLTLYKDVVGRFRSEKLAELSFSFPENIEQITLSFVPATADDLDLIMEKKDQGVLPGYLINMMAELRVEGAVVATAGPFMMGKSLLLETAYTQPRKEIEYALSYPVVGEFRVFGWNLQGGVNLEAAKFETVADLLDASLQGYFATNDIYNAWLAPVSDVVAYRAPSMGVARTVLETDFYYGIPYSVSITGVAFEIERLRTQTADRGRFKRLSGQLGSALASLVLEQAFAKDNGVDALSAIAAALSIGQRVYTLDSETAQAVLPTLGLNEQAQQLIERLLLAYWDVTIPAGTVNLESWSGLGTYGNDPLTGQSIYSTFGDAGMATGVIGGELATLLGWGGILPDEFAEQIKAKSASVKATLEGLIPLAADPLAVDLNDNLLTLIAGALIESKTGPYLPKVLDAHLFSGLLLDHLSLGQVLDPEAPVVTLVVSSETVAPDEPVQVTATATDNNALRSLAVTINDVALPLDENGQAAFTLVKSGVYSIKAIAIDVAGNLASEEVKLLVTAPNDTTAPSLVIHSPSADAEITAPTPIVATVEDESLVSWTLKVKSISSDGYTVIKSGTEIADNQKLATFDPTLLMNGFYQLIFEATDANGQTTQVVNNYKVTGDLKVGNFSFTVEDLSIPVMGMPIKVWRTYDTRRKDEALDFGQGWSINSQNVKVEESRVPGKYWALNRYGSFINQQYCIEPLGSPEVIVTLPNGDVEAFDVVVSPRCQYFSPPTNPVITFVPQSGTTSKLQPIDALANQIYYAEGNLLDFSTGYPFNPSRYRLTTKSGMKYDIDQALGILHVTDLNGHTLSYTKDGIIHSAGLSVTFSRDEKGRITKITDPSGNELRYEYDETGNLVGAIDQLSNTVRYTYNQSHALVEIIDPLDRKQARNIYDESGRLVGQIDAKGNRTDFNHDLEGRRSFITDRLGRVTQLFYDVRGNILTQIDPMGGISRFTYDEFGNRVSETDELGNTSYSKYDDRLNLIEETDAEGNTVRYTYNQWGKETSLTDARGNTFEMAYDFFGNLEKITNPLGHEGINTISVGLVTSTQDTLGNVTSYTYDSRGNKLTETDPLGNTVTYTYDSNGNQLTESRQRTDGGGNVVTETTSYQYDSRNREIQTTDVLGNVSKTEYDALGQEVAKIDAAGRRTEFEYDVFGNLVVTRYPDGTTQARTYDAEKNLLSQTDAAGQTTRYEYDKLDRQVKVVYSDGSVSQTEYDAVGRQLAQVDENGNRSESSYDKAGRRIQSKNALGFVTTFAFDADGNLVSETDANGNTVSYQYDVLGQRVKTLYPGDLFKESIYDAVGRLIAEKDLAGRSTQFEYDAVGRLTSVTKFISEAPVVASFGYDEVGNKISQTDGNGHTTTWTFDHFGRKLSRTLPLGMTETFVYDDQTGNFVRKTDFNAQTTTFSYDPNNDRLLSVNYADGRVESFTYDVSGNRLTQTFPTGTTTYSYDSRHRLVKEIKHNNAVLEYGYDSAGNRTLFKFTPPSGTTTQTQYQYDALNRLQKVIANTGETTYSYDPVGNRQQVTYPNGTYTQYVYDALNRLTSLKTHQPDQTVLSSYQYTLSPTGHRTSITENTGRVVDYTYDDLYRLTEEKITDGGETVFSYQYDAVGNRVYSIEDGVHTQYTYDVNDRLLKQGGVTYQYDANGNNVRIEEEGNVVIHEYDGDDRLVSVVAKEGEQVTSTVGYAYDADGDRLQTTVDGQVIQYVVDSNQSLSQVVAELDQSNQVLVSYLHGDDLISQNRGGDTHFYHYDGLGSTRALSDQMAVVTDRYDYEAFGQLRQQSGETENNYLYTGEQVDPNTGNYYLRARFYNPGSGRFLSMDRFDGINQEPVTLHKYLYGNADPVNMVDPTGLFSLGSISMGTAVRGILNGMAKFDKLMNFMDFVADPVGGMTDKALGVFVLIGKGGKNSAALLRLFSKKFRNGICPFVAKNNSFSIGTPVHTQKGLIAIEDIQIGDMVWSYNETSGEQEWNEVIHLIHGYQKEKSDLVILTLKNGKIITTTAEHPFFVVGHGWQNAEMLVAGGILSLINGNLEIAEVTFEKQVISLYNLSIVDAHTYYIGDDGILVHNVNKKKPPERENDFNCGKIVPHPTLKLISPESKPWKKAVAQLQGNIPGNAQNFRVRTQREAKQLIQEGLPGFPNYKNYRGSEEAFGWEYHVNPEKVNDNVLHIKWWDNRGGRRKKDGSREGHIFFDVWQ